MTMIELTDAELDYVTGGMHREGPGCLGSIVATNNHLSNVISPSGNTNSSAGPGVALVQGRIDDVSGAIAATREINC